MYFTIAVIPTKRNHIQQACPLVFMDIAQISHIPAPITSVLQVRLIGKLSVISFFTMDVKFDCLNITDGQLSTKRLKYFHYTS